MSSPVTFDYRHSQLQGRKIQVPAEGLAALIEAYSEGGAILVASNGIPFTPFHAAIRVFLRQIGCLNDRDAASLVDLDLFRSHFVDKTDLDEAVRLAKIRQPEYPWSDKPTMCEVVYALGGAYDGVCRATDDLHAVIDRFLEVCGPIVDGLQRVSPDCPPSRYVVDAGSHGHICDVGDLRRLDQLVRHWRSRRNPPVTLDEVLRGVKEAVGNLREEDVAVPGLERLLERAEANGQFAGKEAGDGESKKG